MNTDPLLDALEEFIVAVMRRELSRNRDGGAAPALSDYARMMRTNLVGQILRAMEKEAPP